MSEAGLLIQSDGPNQLVNVVGSGGHSPEQRRVERADIPRSPPCQGQNRASNYGKFYDHRAAAHERSTAPNGAEVAEQEMSFGKVRATFPPGILGKWFSLSAEVDDADPETHFLFHLKDDGDSVVTEQDVVYLSTWNSQKIAEWSTKGTV